MARNGSGTYSLPSGNPVVTGTTISSTWANDTMGDLETEMTASLDRNGKGGMLATLRGVDGAVTTPAFSWTSETGSGLYRASAGNCRFAILGSDVLTVTASGLTVTGALDSTTLAIGGTTITATAVELNYVDGVTSSIQAQLDAITSGATVWGDISGTLANQTDLQSALDGKSATSHNHTGTYEPVDATILKEADVDDTPVNGATAAPVSSNWAYDLVNSANTWTGAQTFSAEIVEADNYHSQTTSTFVLDPANGTVQRTILSENVTTVTDSLSNGEYVSLHIDDGTGYLITWPAAWKWIGGATPTLDTTNMNIIEVWRSNGQTYAASVGVASSA